MLKIHNTLSGLEETFEPLSFPKVTMYVCGPTVYDHAHIGHGRAYVAYDAIVRYLRYRKYEVTFVRNLTDIDDKIIKKANQENVSFQQVAEKYAASFLEDMKTLGLVNPDIQPKASETIPEMQALIEVLIQKGHAYVSKGDVYFSVGSLSTYGKLSKRDLEGMKAGARVEPGEQKRDPLDFALWKSAKPGEPKWDSPWGDGRPGWHIECSAMSKKFLGETIDIHAGGRDLIFPHHENEIAQSECANEKTFAKYWLHNGFVTLSQEKMSKSLGNIVTLKELLKTFHPEALKLYLLATHYRHPLEFSDVGVREASKGLDRMYRVLLTIPSDSSAPLDSEVVQKFEEAMDDDFNSAKALGVLFDATKEANRCAIKANEFSKAISLRKTLVHLGKTLGLLTHDPSTYFQSVSSSGIDQQKIEQLVAERQKARREKNFSRSDQIREELRRLGVGLEDGAEGTTWHLLKE